MRFELDTAQISDEYRQVLEAQMFREVGKELRRCAIGTDDPKLRASAICAIGDLAFVRKQWIGQ